MQTATSIKEVFLGLIHADRAYHWRLADSTAHMAVSMTTGMGKSTLVRTAAAQWIRSGGRVAIFDSAKAGDSHGGIRDDGSIGWCRHEDGSVIDGVDLYRTTEQVHEGLIAWSEERHRRSEGSFQLSREPLQPVLIVFEEMNATIGVLRNLWSRIKQQGDSVRSPAIDAILDLTAAGRSAHVHFMAIAQKLTAATCGSDAVRENLGLKILGNCTQRTWRMLTNDQVPYPKRGMSTRPGDVMAVVGTDVTEFHIANITDAQCREWALSGVPQPPGAGLRLPTRDLPSDDVAPVVPTTRSHIASGDSCDTGSATTLTELESAELEIDTAALLPPEVVTLTDALEHGVVQGLTGAALRKYAEGKRGPFPDPLPSRGPKGAKLYNAYDLWMWDETRRAG